MDQADKHGRTPLSIAVEKGFAEVAALLVQEGGAAVDQVRAERVRWAQPAERVEREYLLLSEVR